MLLKGQLGSFYCLDLVEGSSVDEFRQLEVKWENSSLNAYDAVWGTIAAQSGYEMVAVYHELDELLTHYCQQDNPTWAGWSSDG